jgi:CBS-domain-containing membrane protein
LILDELLPLARAGLESRQVDRDDIDKYIGIIEARAETGRTGARWLGLSMDAVAGTVSANEVAAVVVASLHAQQTAGRPVHEWEAPTVEKERALREHYRTVEQLMSTDLFTVNEDEPIDLAAHVMDWKHIRHVPVEDSENHLVGLVSHRALVRLMARVLTEGLEHAVLVREVMEKEVVTVNPETPTLEALGRMKRHKVSCLPVVDSSHRLVGIITERDFMRISGRLLERFLAGDSDSREQVSETRAESPDPPR